MSSSPQSRRIVPLILGAAMLVVVILSVTLPNPGKAFAQTNCGNPPCASSIPAWVYGLLIAGVLIDVVLVLALVLQRRRHRQPTRTGPAQPWQDGGRPGAPRSASPAPPTPPAPRPAPAPAYLETPEDIGQEPPTVSDLQRAGADVAADKGVEPDADSVAAELDRIVREIHRRGQKRSIPPQIEPTGEEPPR